MRRPAHKIPFDLLRPYIQRFLENEAGGFGQMEEEEVIEPFGPAIRGLAFRAGVHSDTLSKAWKGTHATVTFLVADRIICALGIPMIWHTDPELAALYAAPRPTTGHWANAKLPVPA